MSAGSRWRLLVHEPGSTSHDIRPTPQGREPGPWRQHHVIPGEFDELVAGSWLHVEELGADAEDGSSWWWLNISGLVVEVDVDRNGDPTAVAWYPPGEYNDPVPGCEYIQP